MTASAPRWPGATWSSSAASRPILTQATLDRAVDLVRREKIGFILGVGGGSVSDGAKYVAAAALYDGDGWDIVIGKHVPQQALPVGVVLTLPATGSESNAGSVVTNTKTQDKRAFFVPPARPRFTPCSTRR